MAGDSADLIFTDPPYNVDYEGYTEERLKIRGDRMSDTEFKQFLHGAFSSCLPVQLALFLRRQIYPVWT